MGNCNAPDITGNIFDVEEICGEIQPCGCISGELGYPVKEVGTRNYEDLYNKPKINTVELIGNKSFEELGMEAMTNFDIDRLLG